MNRLDTSSPADLPRATPINKLWLFLNRDIRTFKWWGRDTKVSRSNHATLTELHGDTDAKKVTEAAIESEVDPRKIASLRLRRDVLDWRDEFHFNVTDAASQSRNRLASKVDYELSTISFFRNRVFTKSARELLEDHIESCVRSPMRHTLQLEQVILGQRLQGWLPNRHEPIGIWIMWPKLEWDTRLDLKFTVENRDQILSTLHDLILGMNGLADRYRQWANEYTTQVLEKHNVVSNSV